MARRGKGWALAMFVAITPIALVTFRADAFPEGSAFTNCVSCHTIPPSVSATTNVVIAAPATVNAGGTYAIYVYVTNALYQKYGFSMHATGGTWYVPDPIASVTTTVKGGDATQSCWARGCFSDGCTGTFYAYWTAPSGSASSVTFSAYGLAHDGNATGCPGSPTGVGSTGDVTGVAIERTAAIVCMGGSHRCGDECVRDDDPAHCGTSCTPCEAPDGGIARCEGTPYSCVGRCPLDVHECGGVCVPDSPSSCGASCTVCPAPDHATATCTAGACGYACDPGYVACGGACITGTCAGFDTGVDARDGGSDVAIDTAFPEEDTAIEDTAIADTADAGPASEPDSSGCGCATPGDAPGGAGVVAIAGLAVAATIARRRYRRMSM